ncbi:hypothetical protein Efla_001920 [Eimeria flavescens]
MPRGGHRGGIYPVSGLAWGPGQRYLKRGLYRHQRTDVFVPRWGWRRENFNPSPLPDGSTKKWEPESWKAWPLLGVAHHVKMYAKNEERYLQPAFRCTYAPALEHILNMLEPSALRGRCYSGIGLPAVSASDRSGTAAGSERLLPIHLVKAAKKVEQEGDPSVPLVRLPFLEKGRIRRLWEVVLQADTWRSPAARAGAEAGGSNALPVVDERAAVVRELPLAECLRRLAREKLNADTIGALRA